MENDKSPPIVGYEPHLCATSNDCSCTGHTKSSSLCACAASCCQLCLHTYMVARCRLKALPYTSGTRSPLLSLLLCCFCCLCLSQQNRLRNTGSCRRQHHLIDVVPSYTITPAARRSTSKPCSSSQARYAVGGFPCRSHSVLGFVVQHTTARFWFTDQTSLRRCSNTVRHRISGQRNRLRMGAEGAEHFDGGRQRWEELALDRPMETIRLPQGRGLRLHCLSDLHTDYKANLAWVKTWASWKGDETDLARGHEDVLLVSGDVSSSLPRCMETLSDLKDRYDQVFFVIGNHDLWMRASPQGAEGQDREGAEVGANGGSVEKLIEIHRECERFGVRVNPATFVLGGSDEEGKHKNPLAEVCIFPLLSWYHASWDNEPDLPPEDQYRNGDFLRRWGDFRKCRWPAQLCSREDFVTTSRDAPTTLADFFARQNEPCIEAFLSRGKRGGSERWLSAPSSMMNGASGVPKRTLVSFSHFVPRQELCPEKRFLSEPMLTKAIGSDPLERQIRQLGSDVHVYGHTHIPYDLKVDGVRYVQWPLGSVAEQSRQCRRMREEGPFLLYSHDGQQGGLTPEEPTFWGDFYRERPRDVRETFVPEWALKRIRGRRRAQRSSSADS